jgi:hypothetical protein
MINFLDTLSGVDTVDQLAEVLCEIMVCASLSRLSSDPPVLRPLLTRTLATKVLTVL